MVRFGGSDEQLGLSPVARARSTGWVILLHQVPLLALLVVGMLWTPLWATAVLAAGTILRLRGLVMTVVCGVALWLGAPWWWAVGFAVLVPPWRWGVDRFAEELARVRPPRARAQIWKVKCRHRGPERIDRLIDLGGWSDALDAAMHALAQHPRDRTDCLADHALRAAEIAVRAGSLDLARECGGLARDIARDSDSRRSWQVFVRSLLVAVRVEAQRKNFERCWELLEQASKNTNGIRRLDRQVDPLAAAIAGLTERETLETDRITAAIARNLGIRGDAMDNALLDFADWFRAGERSAPALEFYELVRTRTEFDAFVHHRGGVPDTLGRRWSLRGRRFAHAVLGEILCQRGLGNALAPELVEAAGVAATVAAKLGEAHEARALLTQVADSQERRGALDASAATVAAARSIQNRHEYLVSDWTASLRWEQAAEALRKSGDRLASQRPLGTTAGSAVPSDSDWLVGDGLAAARAGAELARRLDDLLPGMHGTALRNLARRLGGVGLAEEAVAVAREVVRQRRLTAEGSQTPLYRLGWPLWRLGVCLRDAGHNAEANSAQIDALPYFRQSAAEGEEPDLCADAVGELALRLIDDKRYAEALPLLLERVRRRVDRAPITRRPTLLLSAFNDLLKTLDTLGRFAEKAEVYGDLACMWENAEWLDEADSRELAAAAHHQAARAWRRAGDRQHELDGLIRAHELMSAIDPDSRLADRVAWLRVDVNYRLGRAEIQGSQQWGRALPYFTEARSALRRFAEAPDQRWHRASRIVCSYLAGCIEETTSLANPDLLPLLYESVEHAWSVDPEFGVRRDGGLANATVNLARVLVLLGRPSDALEAIDGALPEVSEAAAYVEWLHYYAHLAHRMLGHVEQAQTAVVRALASTDQRLDHCLLFLCHGDGSEAEDLIARKASEIPPPEDLRLWHLRRGVDELERILGRTAAIDRVRELIPQHGPTGMPPAVGVRGARWYAEVEPQLHQFDPEARQAVIGAFDEAAELGHLVLRPQHLLLAALHNTDAPVCSELASTRGMTYDGARAFVRGMGVRAAGAPEVSDDFVTAVRGTAAYNAVLGSEGAASLQDLVVSLVRSPDPQLALLLTSFAVTGIAEGADRDSVEVSDPEPLELSAGVDELSGASLLARDVFDAALRDGVSLAGFVVRLLRIGSELDARVSVALRALDTNDEDAADLIEELDPTASVTHDPDSTAMLRRLPAEVARWLRRTGDTHSDTVHLLLAAMSLDPKAGFMKALRGYGVTCDLLVTAAVNARFDVGPLDRPGMSRSLALSSRRGPAPAPARRNRRLPRRQPGARWRRRLFRGAMTTGEYLNTDLQMSRVRRWSFAVFAQTMAGLAYFIAVVGAAVSSQNWWLLAALPVAGINPVGAPLLIWLTLTGAAAIFLPWPARMALAVLVLAVSLQTWVELQWRRADTADPCYDLRRLRHDTFTSRRSVLMGGPR